MLYTVHTSFTERGDDSGFLRRFARTDKIEATDKDQAKFMAWKQIFDGREHSFVTLDSQNARLAHRK